MSANALRGIDRQIAEAMRAADLIDQVQIGARTVEGYYNEEFAERGQGEEAIPGVLMTFDCRAEDLPELAEGATVEVAGYGTRRFLRREPIAADRVLLVLGSLL